MASASARASALPPVSTAAELLERGGGAAARAAVPTGCPRLDALFATAGGVPALGIAELCGEAGSGKTQLCLQMAVRCVLPVELGGLGSVCVYLCAEDALPTARLEAIMRAIVVARLRDAAAAAAGSGSGRSSGSGSGGAHGGGGDGGGGDAGRAAGNAAAASPPAEPTEASIAATTRDMLGRVRVARIADVAALEAALGELERVLAGGRTRLVIVDSIAALHRDLLGQAGYDAPERSRGLTSLAAVLKGFSYAFGVAVVVVNQVSDVVDEDASLAAAQACGPAAPLVRSGAEAAASCLARQMNAVFSNGRWMRPALGIVWSSCVTTRIMMTHPRFEATDEPAAAASSNGLGGGGGGGGGARGGGGGGRGDAAAARPSAAAAADLDLSDLDLEAWDRDVAALQNQQLQQQQPAGPASARRGRQMFLLQSPELAPAVVAYTITAAGVEGVGDVKMLASW